VKVVMPVRVHPLARAAVFVQWTAAIAMGLPFATVGATAPVCDPPEARIVLQLRAGAASADKPQGSAQACDLNGLEKLPAREIATALPSALGLPGTHQWKGVSLRHLVEMLGANENSHIQVTALNDYSIQIPWSDLVRYDPIVAYRRNQQRMTIRDKGPLILIYPFDGTPHLQVQEYVNRTIWQINAISVR
jgi:hypothetical protein